MTLKAKELRKKIKKMLEEAKRRFLNNEEGHTGDTVVIYDDHPQYKLFHQLFFDKIKGYDKDDQRCALNGFDSFTEKMGFSFAIEQNKRVLLCLKEKVFANGIGDKTLDFVYKLCNTPDGKYVFEYPLRREETYHLHELITNPVHYVAMVELLQSKNINFYLTYDNRQERNKFMWIEIPLHWNPYAVRLTYKGKDMFFPSYMLDEIRNDVSARGYLVSDWANKRKTDPNWLRLDDPAQAHRDIDRLCEKHKEFLELLAFSEKLDKFVAECNKKPEEKKGE